MLSASSPSSLPEPAGAYEVEPDEMPKAEAEDEVEVEVEDELEFEDGLEAEALPDTETDPDSETQIITPEAD
jgi:hypothetical protein